MAEIPTPPKPAADAPYRCTRGDCQRPMTIPAVSVKESGTWRHYCLGCEPA